MLDLRTYELITHETLLAVARQLLGPEVTVNGDYYFRPALSDHILDWGLEFHQDSWNCKCRGALFALLATAAEEAAAHVDGGDTLAKPLQQKVEGLQVLTLWLPLVPVDRTSGALSLVKGSHRLGKIWPATVPPEERSLDRKTTFSDLVPRPAVVGRDPSTEWGVSENWPEGVGKYGELVAAEMKPGDLMAFHNMILWTPNLARWSLNAVH